MTAQDLRCEAHQAETRLTCAQCGAPICPQCMVRTDVGLRCGECAAPAHAPTKVPRRRNRAFALALSGLGLLAVLGAAVLLIPFDGEETVVGAPEGEVLGEWAEAPALGEVRGETSAVALDGGEVLIVGGGLGRDALPAAERFDPGAEAWRAVGSLGEARRGHDVARLDDGRVLAAGGIDEGEVLASAEIFDPDGDEWEPAGEMTQPRLGHTLTALDDGRVLALGGASGERPDGTEHIQAQVIPTPTAELFDPETGEWTAIGDMLAPRFEHSATRLPDGRVLLAGGLTVADDEVAPTESVELFDPATDTFSRAAPMEVGRTDHAAVTLADDRVLVAGGDLGNRATGRVEIFDFGQGRWRGAASLARERRGHAATLLSDGTVLVTGGESVREGSRTSLGAAERYDPQTDEWNPAGEMSCPRSRHGQAALPDGRVLAAAGDAAFPGEPPVARSCADVYDPG
jgi:N-acetylneuraminic acid mutarotase